MKALIVCPNCIKRGIKQTLAKVSEHGEIIIRRSRSGIAFNERNNVNTLIDHTIIVGADFALVCGACGESVFIKKGGKHESRDYWITRFFGTASFARAGTAGTFSHVA